MYTDTQTHIKNPNLSKTLLKTQSIRNHKSHIAPLNNPFYQRQKGEKEEDRKEDRSFVTEGSPACHAHLQGGPRDTEFPFSPNQRAGNVATKVSAGNCGGGRGARQGSLLISEDGMLQGEPPC